MFIVIVLDVCVGFCKFVSSSICCVGVFIVFDMLIVSVCVRISFMLSRLSSDNVKRLFVSSSDVVSM